jgi:hypothetical protein
MDMTKANKISTIIVLLMLGIALGGLITSLWFNVLDDHTDKMLSEIAKGTDGLASEKNLFSNLGVEMRKFDFEAHTSNEYKSNLFEKDGKEDEITIKCLCETDVPRVMYPMLIYNMCEFFDLDPYMCLAMVYIENGELREDCVHLNSNKTRDLGLWQLNDKYISYFKDKYWDFNFDFDCYNGAHNTYVALKHIKTLHKLLGDWKRVVMAYNCGYTNVERGTIPQSTFEYWDKVEAKAKTLLDENFME